MQSTNNEDGTVTLQWGVNGYSASTEVDLLIDEYTDSATTDHGGSGGFTVTFGFPDSGDYSWNVEGAADGHGESNTDGDIDRTCIPGGGAATSPVRRTGRADSHDKMVPLTAG